MRHVYSLLVVVLGWVLFACADVTAAGNMYKAMFGIGVPLADNAAIFTLVGSILLLILCTIGATTLPQRAANKLKSTMGESKFSYLGYTVLALVLLASVAFLVADSYNPFLYFRF